MGGISPQNLQTIVKAIERADAIIACTGAGMGVDSGLPDFRGAHGFWKAYPLFEKLGLQFQQMSNPSWFLKDAPLAYGFWTHRQRMYAKAPVHGGYHALKTLGQRTRYGLFSFTSNVDGMWEQVLPPERVLECHGSVHYLQCYDDCSGKLWESAAPFAAMDLDEQTLRAAPPLPSCPDCQEVARPAVLMFGDGGWNDSRYIRQHGEYQTFLSHLDGKHVVIVEIGAGRAVPTVRLEAESLCYRFSRAPQDQGSGFLIRINPNEQDCQRSSKYPGVSVQMGGRAALEEILLAVMK